MNVNNGNTVKCITGGMLDINASKFSKCNWA